MGKKGGAKKGGGKKKAAEPEVNPADVIPSDLMGLNEQQLKERIESWGYRRRKAAKERNYMEMEKDMVNRFYGITTREIEQLEAAILCKERQMEVAEKEHRVKIKVHEQKVHNLSYQQVRESEDISKEAELVMVEDNERHVAMLTNWHRENEALKESMAARKLSREDEVKMMEQGFAKSLGKLKETYEVNHAQLKKECQAQVDELKTELEVRRRVEIHELRERKNLHMNELMENHEEAFEQMKGYYKDITVDNVKLIRSLKDEIAEMRSREKVNRKITERLMLENRTLAEPLAEMEEERAKLMDLVKNYGTDKIVLRNLKGRKSVLEKNMKEARAEYRQTEDRMKKLEKERDEVTRRFAKGVEEMHRLAELKNIALEKRLGELGSNYSNKQVQLEEIVRSASIDPAVLQSVTEKLEGVLESKNEVIKSLRYEIQRLAKMYNDTIRVYEYKLKEFGVPLEEMGFEPVPVKTSQIPADLVATSKGGVLAAPSKAA
ncbi:Dynein regulatory complex subunit 4 [Perkinsus chesapeaki]|uniref:Dynein regulatory complex subunit 4 n=1 Tax=Perkinsus chesapeaki TaxID=330153 RepID=A0A7J6M618_PERCH|nr:Dynein regulatory complex subunit 4 [Perkinsus chesapeaki]